MAGGQLFQNIDRGRNHLAFAILYWLRKIQSVEQHITKLLGRIDIEFRPAALINFLGFGFDLGFQSLRHFAQSCPIDCHTGLLHAGEDRNQGQINFVIQLQEPSFFHFLAQRPLQSASDVRCLGERSAEFEIEVSQCNIRKAVR